MEDGVKTQAMSQLMYMETTGVLGDVLIGGMVPDGAFTITGVVLLLELAGVGDIHTMATTVGDIHTIMEVIIITITILTMEMPIMDTLILEDEEIRITTMAEAQLGTWAMQEMLA